MRQQHKRDFITCMNDRQWDGPLEDCEIIHCSNLTANVSNAHLISQFFGFPPNGLPADLNYTDMYFQNGTFTYKCDQGFTYEKGDIFLMCTLPNHIEFGKWQPNNIKCIRMHFHLF